MRSRSMSMVPHLVVSAAWPYRAGWMSAPPVISTPWAASRASFNSTNVNSEALCQWMTSGDAHGSRESS